MSEPKAKFPVALNTAESTGTAVYIPDASFLAQPVSPRFDYLVRVSGQEISGSYNVNVAFTNTSSFFTTVTKGWEAYYSRDIVSLVSVIHWQHSILDYNAHYNAYLLNQISEEEFESSSEAIAYEPQDIDPAELANKIRTIVSLTGIDYTPSDFAGLFRCSEESVQKALQVLSP